VPADQRELGSDVESPGKALLYSTIPKSSHCLHCPHPPLAMVTCYLHFSRGGFPCWFSIPDILGNGHHPYKSSPACRRSRKPAVSGEVDRGVRYICGMTMVDQSAGAYLFRGIG
jgi:hypothetical protein